MISRKIRLLFLLLVLILSYQDYELSADEESKKPNILFVIADDWSANHAGAYGCEWIKTPSFDQIAKEGILFENCFTSNPKCSPCRASILTGRNSWQLEEGSCHFGNFPSQYKVYPSILKEAGYHVGYTGKGWGPGKHDFEDNPAGKKYSSHTIVPPYSGISKVDYAKNFQEFLDDRKNNEPFCFWMGVVEPHRGYEKDSGIKSGKSLKTVTVPKFLPDNDIVRGDLLDYAVEVEWFDTQLGRAIEILKKKGELDNTVVVVTSDHGMPFPRAKGQIYEEGYRLPLAIRWGNKIKPNKVVKDFINARDFAPTFLDLAGLKTHSQMTGNSFMDKLLSGQSGWIDENANKALIGKERHDVGRPYDWGYPVRALRSLKYVCQGKLCLR